MWTKVVHRGPCFTMISGTKTMDMRTSGKEELRSLKGSPTSPDYPEPCSVAASYRHIRQSRRRRQCGHWWAGKGRGGGGSP